jgi:hypothetical protein
MDWNARFIPNDKAIERLWRKVSDLADFPGLDDGQRVELSQVVMRAISRNWPNLTIVSDGEHWTVYRDGAP